MQQAVGCGYEEWGADRLLTVGILREEGHRSDMEGGGGGGRVHRREEE